MLEVTSQLPVKLEELAPLPSPIPHTWPPGSSLTILIQKGGEGKAGEAWEHDRFPPQQLPAWKSGPEQARLGSVPSCHSVPSFTR